MSTIKVTVSVEIDAGADSQCCRRTIMVDSANPLFHALETEKAAASATEDCVEMVAAAFGGRDKTAVAQEATR